MIRNRQRQKLTTDQFDIMVGGNPALVTATCYQTYNKETRYRVTVNDSPVYIFKWDHDLNRWSSNDAELPLDISPQIEEAIAMRLNQKLAA